MNRDDSRTARHEPRVLRVPRAMGFAIAIPVVLALGAATVTTFLVGVAAVLIAPRLRRRTAWPNGRTRRSGRTITLDRSAYRTGGREDAEEHGTAARTFPIAVPRPVER
jgi:hypothetical protein